LIFLANVLVMNGGSTFLIRTCREFKRQGIPTAVLLLRRQVDAGLLADLEQFSTVIYLDNYLIDRAFIFRSHLGVFGPVSWERIQERLRPFGNLVHAMGVFGLVFGYRLCGQYREFNLTAGVYHQNEFLFRKSRFYFSNNSAKLFRELPIENVVFFNEISRNNYSEYFSNNYSASPTLPIGIDLPISCEGAYSSDACRIVSVGNLVEFKTYNEHIIRALPALRDVAPRVRYDIYGTGSEEKFLRKLAREVRVEDIVSFNGEILYSELNDTLANSTLFVGSGTALLEAGARGIPAMIGIESIRTPDTYGFLSNVDGFSYNENVPYIEKYSIEKLLDNFLRSSDSRNDLSEKCRLKAREFAVEKTVQGFVNLQANAQRVVRVFGRQELIKMITSFVCMVVLQRFLGEPLFSKRRSQSYSSAEDI